VSTCLQKGYLKFLIQVTTEQENQKAAELVNVKIMVKKRKSLCKKFSQLPNKFEADRGNEKAAKF
jgi:hypothetical protein